MNQQRRNRTGLRLESLENRNLLASVSIVASQDNTMFEDAQGSLSNGAGQFLFAGRTNQPEGVNLRRALVHFDLENQIPEGATINSVSLSLTLSRAISGDLSVDLHRLLEVWGDGTSDAAGQEGRGAAATAGDATWLHNDFPSSTWTTPGGTFVNAPSASTTVGIDNTAYRWSSDQMIADVQAWLDDAGDNFGWMLIGPESTNGTAKRFNSSEHEDASSRPTLTIDFDQPQPAPTATVIGATSAEGAEPGVLSFSVTLSAAPAEEVSLNYATVDDSAIAGQDYESASGTLTFAPNDPLTKTIDVTVIDDSEDEPDESLLLQLSDPLGVELQQTVVIGTIEDNDAPPLPWHNTDLPLDTTGDGLVVPRDALVIINYINANGAGPLPDPGPDGPPPFLDVSGDGQITALDALRVINHINTGAAIQLAATDAVLAASVDEDE